ncbi:putative RAMP superfamily protein probably involved in DNA repair [Leptolyngbya sp. PCC 7375]|nr:putative RAMP superfamily protein probably involved in DNA repair [Leptolyngbya sp. PCC 7375]
MARHINQRIKITGTLIAQTALHVGGLGTDPTVDLALAVNGRNQLYIPGTSLAGAFRNWMEEHDIEVNSIWGFQDKDRGHASFIIVDDADVQLPNDAIAELRDHVAIDRALGSASDKTKFDRALLPKGSHFPLSMTIDLAEGNPQCLTAVEQLIYALEHHGLRLGAAKTRGLGLIKLTDGDWKKYDLSSFAGTIATLKREGKSHKPTAAITSRLLHLSIEWEPVGAVMVKSGQDGVAVDILPLASRVHDQVAFVLPGSAIKGALRSQAERILRTILQITAISNEKLQTQIEHPKLELAHWLFGKPGEKNKKKRDNGKDMTPQFGRGALMVDDCYCQQQIEPKAWQAVEQAMDDPNNLAAGTLRGSLDAAGLTETQQAFHVAIDRWTGGAADQMLYSALEPFDLQWHPIELTLNLNRIPVDYHLFAQALLWLTLRDLALGRIPLGYGVNRGYGSLQVNKIQLTAPSISELHGKEVRVANGQIVGIDLTPLNTAWQTWLNSQEVAA